MCAISALNPQRFRGFGPSDPRLYNALYESRNYTRFSHSSSSTNETTDSTSSSSLSYLNISNCPSIKELNILNDYYYMTSVSVAHEINMSSIRYGQCRLSELLINRGFKLKGKYKKMFINEKNLKNKRKNKKQKLKLDEKISLDVQPQIPTTLSTSPPSPEIISNNGEATQQQHQHHQENNEIISEVEGEAKEKEENKLQNDDENIS